MLGGVGGHHDNTEIRPAAAQLMDHVDAIHPGQAEIEQHDVRRMVLACCIDAEAVFDFGDDLQRRRGFDQVLQTQSHDRVIFDDQDADLGGNCCMSDDWHGGVNVGSKGDPLRIT